MERLCDSVAETSGLLRRGRSLMSSFCHEVTFQLLVGALPQTHSTGSLNALWGRDERFYMLLLRFRVYADVATAFSLEHGYMYGF